MSVELQKHNYSSYKDLLDRFARENVRPSTRWIFLGLTRIWRFAFGIDKSEKIIASDFARDEDGFWHDDWIWKQLYYPEISATFVGDAPACEPAYRAAQLIHGALWFFRKTRVKDLHPEVLSGRPQDMGRYRFFFSRLTLTRIEKGQLRHRITQIDDSDYIVVGFPRSMYRLTVMRDGTIAPIEEIYQGLKQCEAAEARSHSGYRPPLSELTGLQNLKSAALWQAFSGCNQDEVVLLDQALFSLSIDPTLLPTNDEQKLRGLHVTPNTLKDWRRSMQVMVGGDGCFSIEVNPHAGIGGTLSAKLTSELSRACQRPIETRSGVASKWSPIVFKQPSNWSFSDLELVKSEYRRRLYEPTHATTFRLPGIGRRQISHRGFHVDAAFHAALSLAWFRDRGYAPTIGNFINLRSVKHGDIWRYDATTDALIRFVNGPTLETYRAAEAAHKQLIKVHKSADDAFYLGAMGLKRLVNDGHVPFAGFVSLVLMSSFFVKDFSRRFLNPDLWVSCIPTYPGVSLAGRAGAKMSYLAKTSTGGHYMIFDEHTMVCLMNPDNGMWMGTEARFAEAIGVALRDILELN